jgi:DHA2 family multidrug resistance protein
VGGGIGISILNAMVVRHQQIHRAELVQNLAPENPAFRQAYNAANGLMSQVASPNVAVVRAYGIIQGTVEQQAAAFAYVDVFRYLALACFVCGGIVFFMKRVQGRKGAAALAH